MPIYEYQCSKCQHRFEEWVKSPSDQGEEPCPKCGAASPRIMSQTSFVLKGGGWYVDDYGYRKGIKEEGGAAAASSSPTPAEASPAAPTAPAPAAAPAAAPATPAPAAGPAKTDS
ncbi:zinc ribbon domain-containing protein [Desulfovibrio sp.]|uniref:FmdB family zinc ribbon protein n=1 Tax=Desulfovibrio sp. TaxID=885 RepID=UPI0025B821FF|nr:zinc ribbon domain-containing protein [Desulfovibrio sp.]